MHVYGFAHCSRIEINPTYLWWLWILCHAPGRSGCWAAECNTILFRICRLTKQAGTVHRPSHSQKTQE